MARLNIALLGDPVLRQKASEIDGIDEDLRILADDMFETMYAAEGIGLAAPQVGISRRLIVIDLNDEAHPRFALVNPKVVERGRETDRIEEGCLSIPGVSALVERPVDVVVEGVDLDGHPVRIEASDLVARCLLHEIDHLDGILFTDHLSALKRSMLIKKYRSLQSEESADGRPDARLRRSG